MVSGAYQLHNASAPRSEARYRTAASPATLQYTRMGTFITRLLLFALVAPERLDGPLDAARHTPKMN